MEEILEELSFICDDLDGLLREAGEERARDLQEGPSNSVVRSPPWVGSHEWRRLNRIHQMRPGPGRRAQRATRSCPYLWRVSSRHPGELWGPGEPGRAPGSPVIELRVINTSLVRGDEGVPSSLVGRLGLLLQGEELVRMSGAELGLLICNPPEDWSVWDQGGCSPGSSGGWPDGGSSCGWDGGWYGGCGYRVQM